MSNDTIDIDMARVIAACEAFSGPMYKSAVNADADLAEIFFATRPENIVTADPTPVDSKALEARRSGGTSPNYGYDL